MKTAHALKVCLVPSIRLTIRNKAVLQIKDFQGTFVAVLACPCVPQMPLWGTARRYKQAPCNPPLGCTFGARRFARTFGALGCTFGARRFVRASRCTPYKSSICKCPSSCPSKKGMGMGQPKRRANLRFACRACVRAPKGHARTHDKGNKFSPQMPCPKGARTKICVPLWGKAFGARHASK